MAHPEIGRRILERLIEELKELIEVERMPRQEGNNMIAIFSPKK
jgi:translation initiation factor IF-3